MTEFEPASAHSSAAPQVVWDVLIDGPRWSFWNPGVEWMWIEGAPAPGALATIKLKGVRQTAVVIEEILAPQRFAIRLTVGPVARLDLSWSLEPQGTGTRIDSRVTIDGPAAGFLLRRTAVRVAAAMPASLARLAERAATGSIE